MAGFLVIIGSVFLIWVLYASIRANPQLLSRANLSKSFTTMGVLGLLLIGIVMLTVLLLQQS